MSVVRRDRVRDIEGAAMKTSKGYYKWLEERNKFLNSMQINLLSNNYELFDGPGISAAKQFHLCEACESVWSNLRGERYPYLDTIFEHASTPVELQTSARKNCHFCTMI